MIVALVGLLVLAACSGSPTPTPTASSRTLEWTAVPLPAGLNPSSLVVAGDSVLVGGRSTAGRERPGLVTVAADGGVTQLGLKPISPYA